MKIEEFAALCSLPELPLGEQTLATMLG